MLRLVFRVGSPLHNTPCESTAVAVLFGTLVDLFEDSQLHLVVLRLAITATVHV